MNSLPKFVVSTILQKAEWNNSHLIKENVAQEISGLKQQPGQDTLVAGSCTLIQTLTQHNPIDEYLLLVYPVVLGSGKRLFRDGSNEALKLVESKAFSSGVVLFCYQPDIKAK
jgi:dihydrofolate reductase